MEYIPAIYDKLNIFFFNQPVSLNMLVSNGLIVNKQNILMTVENVKRNEIFTTRSTDEYENKTTSISK